MSFRAAELPDPVDPLSRTLRRLALFSLSFAHRGTAHAARGMLRRGFADREVRARYGWLLRECTGLSLPAAVAFLSMRYVDVASARDALAEDPWNQDRMRRLDRHQVHPTRALLLALRFVRRHAPQTWPTIQSEGTRPWRESSQGTRSLSLVGDDLAVMMHRSSPNGP